METKELIKTLRTLDCGECKMFHECEAAEEKPCLLFDAAAERLERLAAYEDTGLEPEEVVKNYLTTVDIREMGGIDHLRELAQAEQDGRLVVLPCKVGDTVYFPKKSRWDSATVEHIEVGASVVWGFSGSSMKLGRKLTSFGTMETLKWTISAKPSF